LRSERDGHHVPVLADFGGTLRAHAWTPPKDAAQARSYWAPELRETGPKTVAADVYALGKLLSATTGSRGGDEVAAVIAKATSRLPEDRYPDALAMHEALEALDVASSSTAEASAGEKPAAAVASASTPDAASAASPVQPLAVAAEALASQPDGDDLPPMGFYTPPSRAADFRSKGPIIALVAALALLALVLSLVFTKSNVFNRPTEVPVPSVAKTKSVYRGVQFTLNQPAQPSDHKHVRWLEVSADGSWQQVGGVTYTARTSVGGEKACVQFRVADQNEDGTDITYGTPISACGESNPPALKVKIDPNNCVYNGFPQVCYTFVAEGFEPGSTHILTLRLSNQLIGTLQLTVDKSGHATLPKGQHFHFESTAGGKIASVTYAGLTQNWIVANV